MNPTTEPTGTTASNETAIAAEIAAWLHKFPHGAIVRIEPLVPGRYRVGYEYKNITYTPGIEMHPLVEGLRRCHLEFAKQFPKDAQP